ncbi:MAG TPA: carboxypeptidase-like regulatory domain-containing protein [Nocardioides sp.]|uniref:carboxypeptidase-like regulatory domain-containing protein n=1 Tax=Nocardioides sp. TaxID=35761 RepID=UPI002B5F3300|nr:carboxypeptidase-like regulatory domain-containing protein [Nocardioides sp.]HTW17561.1 carboxypeptidase-like regulatory domain-containing protein [Nocardioides sp.]
MHVDISPRRFELTPGVPQPITVTISNTGTVIGGYAVRVLGADPSWVTTDDGEISLFPDESRAVSVMIAVPPGMTAGERRVSVQVRELTPPEESVVEDVVFTVPEAPEVKMRVDPMAVTAGRTARLNVLLDNTGNTAIHRRLHGQDPESRVRFRFDPAVVRIEPGEHALVDVRASARQPFLGNPVVRPLELRLVDPDYVPTAPPPEPAKDEAEDDKPSLAAPSLGRRKKAPPPRIDDEAIPVLANATFVQRPMVSRGPISLLGLLVAVTVFAVVITLALSRIVGQSAADRNLALEIAAAREGGSSSGTSGMGGTVTLLTSNRPVEAVAVNVFAASDTEAPVANAATDANGKWSVGKLPAGDYKVTFRGAGFVQLWFPQAVDPADGETITLEAGNQRAGLDVALGGVPASVAGTVSGTDVSAATLTLKAPLSGMATDPAVAGATPSTATAEQGATVMSVPIGEDGTFVLENVPSPSVYDLVVEKQGFATSTQRIDVSAGEERTGVEITLRQGDGVISGIVSSATGPLPEATVVATSGQTSVTTMSLTAENNQTEGSFTLRGLPTPASFTVVVSLPDHASQTLTLTLGAGQRLTGVSIMLDSSSGVLKGQVLTEADEQPAPGVLVSVTDGVQTVQTATSSREEDAGEWRVTGLALPGEYTVTFSRADLATQTRALALDARGKLVEGGTGTTSTSQGIAVSLRSATAVVAGVVRQKQTQGAAQPIGEAQVTLSSNTSTYQVTTASVPSHDAGEFRLEAVPQGTYTLSISRNGVSPVSRIVDLTAGQVWNEPTLLPVAASVSGQVMLANGPAGSGWVVEMYRSSQYPEVVYRTVRTGAQGAFSFADVDAPEAYIIQVRRTRGSAASGSTTVQVDASEQARANVEARSDD